MSVKPELAFDVCWEVYRMAREVLEAKRGVGAVDWRDTGKYLWRPDIRPRLNEWVADFALAGHFLGLSEQGWVNWSEQVRNWCGRELLKRGMFPPRRYFGNGG